MLHSFALVSEMKLLSLFIFSFIFSITAAAPIINPRGTLTLPSDDPFYSPPSGYENTEIGSVLRVKKLESPIGLVFLKLNVKEIYQILVHSQDTFNQSSAVVATVLVPYNANPGKLVSYQMAEDTASVNCAPSYAMQLESDYLSWITPQVELLLIMPLLDEGYFVVVPDHEGPKATYIAGYQAGHSILNSIRGTISLGSDIGISPDPEITIWGYSGGAYATSWAASLHPTYAPELNLVGAAMGGVAVNLAHLSAHCMGNIFSGFMFAAILGLTHEYPELAEEFPKLIKPGMLDYLYTAQDHCLAETLAFFAYATWDQYCIDGVGILNNPILKDVLDQNNVLNNGKIPTIPLLFYSSVNDEVMPIEDTEELYDYYCSNGVNVELRKDIFSGHIITAIEGSGLGVSFIKDRFNHVELNPTCQNSTVSWDLFDEGGLAGLLDIAGGDVDLILGTEAGPSEPFSNTTSTSSTPGIVETVLNFVLSYIASATTPENGENLSEKEVYSLLAGYLRSVSSTVSSVYGLVSSLFGFGSSSDSTSGSSNSTAASLSGGLVSSLLSTGTSLASDFLDGSSNSSTTGTSSLSGGLVSSLLSTGTSLVSGLLDGSSNSSTTDSTSLSSGGLSSILSGASSLLSGLFGSSSSGDSSSSSSLSGSWLSSALSLGSDLVSNL